MSALDRALTQVVAHMGYALANATAPSHISGADEIQIVRRVARRDQVRTECRTILRICRALPPVHRRRLWSDFRAGWQVARGGAR